MEDTDEVSCVSCGNKRKRHANYGPCCMAIIKNIANYFVEEELQLRRDHVKGAEDGKAKAARILQMPFTTVREIVSREIKAKIVTRPELQMPQQDLDKIRPVVVSLIQSIVFPTVSLIHEELKEKHPDWSWSRTEVYRALKLLHFSYISRSDYYYMYIRNQPFNLAQRWDYLVQYRKYQDQNRPIFFMDESWINKNIMPSHGWSDGSLATIPRTPAGKGARWILLGAGGPDGWVPNTYEMFIGKKKSKAKKQAKADDSDDYHTEMNANKFQQWLTKRFLPNVPKNAVLILDRASYHREMVESSKGAQERWLKGDLIDWLKINHGYSDSDVKGKNKKDVFALCKKHKPAPIYKAKIWIDEWNLETGSDIKLLYLPVANPELNPIEHVWCFLKQYVAKNNVNHSMTDIGTLAQTYVVEKGAKCWKDAISMTENYISFTYGSQLAAAAAAPVVPSADEGEELYDDASDDEDSDSSDDEDD